MDMMRDLSRTAVHICALLALLLSTAFLPGLGTGWAAQVREGDLVLQGQAPKAVTVTTGHEATQQTKINKVDVNSTAHTGIVNVTGKATNVTTQAAGQNASAASTVGSVDVGNK